MVETRGEILKIPMPGHSIGKNDEAVQELIKN